MEVVYNLKNMTVKIEGSTQIDIFEKIAKFQEIFSLADECGACHSKNVRYVVREVAKKNKTFKYHELHCQNPQCKCRLSFGQHSSGEGTLFPRRKDENGNYLPNGGWKRYDPNKQEKDE